MQPQRQLPINEDTALAELYQRHVYTLLSLIRRSVPTREDAEDVLLEVFTAALERNALAGLSEHEQLAWLRRVAHNKCVDLYRLTHRRPASSLETGIELFEDEELAPEQVALRSEEHALLYTHLTKLPEQQQHILRLRFGHGLRCTEIARNLNKSESSVRMLLSRALNRLRGIYGQGENEDE